MMRIAAQLMVGILVLVLSSIGCGRQQEGTAQQEVPPGETSRRVGQVWINPGPDTARVLRVQNPYAGNLEALQQGRRLFTWYNCNTCHAPYGGGAIGPSLRDTVWIYGGDPMSIFASIVEGRPQGMPTWHGKIPEDDIWKIVAYVQSLSQPGGSPVSRVPEPASPGE